MSIFSQFASIIPSLVALALENSTLDVLIIAEVYGQGKSYSSVVDSDTLNVAPRNNLLNSEKSFFITYLKVNDQFSGVCNMITQSIAAVLPRGESNRERNKQRQRL